MSEEKQKNLGFLVNSGPYTFQNIDTACRLANAAMDKGYGVNMFLFMDGVIAQNADIKSPGERHIPTLLSKLGARGARIVGCGECAKFRGVLRKNTVQNTRLAGIASLAEMIEDSDRFISLGV